MSRFLLCSFALVLLYPTAIDLYLVGLPKIAQDLGASESQLHIAFSIYLLGMATTMLFAGKVADKVGRKPVAITGATVFALASWLGSVAETSSVFLVARFVQGIGAGSCYVVAFAILRDTLDDNRRAKVLSMLNGITCIIPVIAPVIGHLIMLKFPWPSLFSAMAGMGVLVGLISCLVLKESLVAQSQVKGAESSGDATKLEPFFQRFFISRVVMTSLGVTAILTYVNTSPIVIMELLNFSRGEYSTTMALMALVGMSSSFSAPILLSYFQQRTLIFTSKLFLIASALVLVLGNEVGDSNIFLLGFGLLSVGFSMGFGVAMSQALSPFSLRAGVASSLLGIAQVCSSAFYIWLMGVLGVSALNMLVIALSMAGIIGIALILFVPYQQNNNTYEEITGTS